MLVGVKVLVRVLEKICLLLSSTPLSLYGLYLCRACVQPNRSCYLSGNPTVSSQMATMQFVVVYTVNCHRQFSSRNRTLFLDSHVRHPIP